MKYVSKIALLALLVSLVINSCKKETRTTQNGISPEVIAKISNLGFDATNVQKIDEGYLVEGDIILTNDNLNQVPNSPTLRIANVEQYRTYNLVTNTPRVITVSVSGKFNSNVSSAVDNAIARYNAQGLVLTFQRVSSGGTINIRIVNGGSFIASSGFPSSSGTPYPTVSFNKQYQNWSNTTLSTVFSHEMGHCIGFRHTDYMDRSFSCGGSPVNEGAGTVGAVYIPGTATGPDAGSWMLACIGNGDNRPFNPNDVTALKYLY